MACRNCGHPHSDHVTRILGTNGEVVVTSCFYPIHRNYDCPCTKFERSDEKRQG